MAVAIMFFLPSDYEAPVTIIEKVLECGEAVALLVGGDEQSGFVNISSLTKYILLTITKYILHHCIFYKICWLLRNSYW